MRFRRGPAVVFAAAAASLGGAEAFAQEDAPPRPPGLPRAVEVLKSAQCGLDTLYVTRRKDGPPDALSIYVSDGTRRGTRRMGDVPGRLLEKEHSYLYPGPDFRGPEGGWTWLTGRDPATGGSVLWFVSPAGGIVRGFGPDAGVMTGFDTLRDALSVAPTREGVWVQFDRAGAGPDGPRVVRFQPFPDSDASPQEWDVAKWVSRLVVSEQTALFAQDGGDGAGVELWEFRRGVEGARRAADLLPGPSSSYPQVTALASPLVLLSGYLDPFTGQTWVVDLDTGETRTGAELLGLPTARLSARWSDGGRLLCEDIAGVQGSDPILLEATPEGTTATAFPIGPGPDASWCGIFPTARDGLVYFGADDGVRGCEPWVLDVATKQLQALDLVLGPPSSGVFETDVIGGAKVFLGRLPSGADAAWVVRGTDVARFDEPPGTTLTIDTGRIEASDGRRRRVLYRHTTAEGGTFDDGDGLGFTDDVVTACRGWGLSPEQRTPAGNAAAHPAGALEVRRLSTKNASADVEIVLPAPTDGAPLAAGMWIVDVGGLVEGESFAPGAKRGGRGKGRIVRSIAEDGRVLVRARVVGGAPRRDGPGGTIPVLVWRETERFEGAAAPR